MQQTKAEQALEFITNALNNGLTVYISTMYKVTKITPANYAKWEKSEHKLFKIDAEGNLRLASGKTYNIIVTKTLTLVGIKAIK